MQRKRVRNISLSILCLSKFSLSADAACVLDAGIEETQSFPETPSTRLTSYILSILLPLLPSKEKTVRYRSTQLIAHIINSLDSIDDDYFHLLKNGLLKRARDKEQIIRVQAILGLGRLASNEDNGELPKVDRNDIAPDGLLEKLLEILQNDPSADVRRSLLLSLPLTPGTLPYLLERARDQDAGTRRALYSRVLPALGDFRHLSLSMREKLLRWGLRDRDENVRKATARLFCERWIEDCVGPGIGPENGTKEEAGRANIEPLLELLERIDVINSGGEVGVALEAMKEFWEARHDYKAAIEFDDTFWDRLTPESVFMARSFNDFCTLGGENLGFTGEEKIPEVTKLAFVLQRYTKELIDCLRRNNIREETEEEDTVEQEFIVEQLLHISKTLDYSDEVGRRKMFSFLREILAIAELPDEITKLVVDVLRDVCGLEVYGEKEFCEVVLEAVAEVHDTISLDEPLPEDEDESFHSAQSEISDNIPTKDGRKKKPIRDGSNTELEEAKAIREIMVNMKCLHIAQCMLQNVEGDLQQNLHLVTTLNNLVVPAVRSHEAPIRERGLICLGLCCLLDKVRLLSGTTFFVDADLGNAESCGREHNSFPTLLHQGS
jgi:condensin complex subunit 3